MQDERKGFTFFKSYFEAAQELPDDKRLEFYDAVIQYGLGVEDEVDVSGIARALFVLVKPTLEKGRARAKAGETGGKSKQNSDCEEANAKQTASKPQANAKQNGSKTEANDKQTASDNIMDKDEDKDMDMDMDEDNISLSPLPPLEPPATTPKGAKGHNVSLSDSQRLLFRQFWEAYPRKVSMGDAEKAWLELSPDEELAKTIIGAVAEAVKRDIRFKTERYTPIPSTWLRSKSWLNKYTGSPPASKVNSVPVALNYQQKRYSDEDLKTMGIEIFGEEECHEQSD